MPQSLTRRYAHLVFSTKNREPFLDEVIRARVHAYLATTIRDLGSPWIVVGGVADHVHILFDKDRGEADHYVRNQEEHHRRRIFQDEYRAMLTRYGIERSRNLGRCPRLR